MNENEIKLNAPAVYAESPVDEVSEHYVFVPTTQLISDFAKLGWTVDRAKQQRSRKDPMHTKHLLVFRSNEFPEFNGVRPELVTINSHDRTASFNFMIGLFRTICINGLIVANKEKGGIFESLRVRHIGYSFDQLEALTNTILENMPNVIGWVNRLQKYDLTPETQREFAIKAVATRFKEYVNDEGIINVPAIEKAINIDELLIPHRKEDEGDNIWVVYNRIQEKLVKGGFQRIGTVDNISKRVRGITNIKLDIDVNKSLWELANSYIPS
jgi:hypothetical protein